MRLGTSEPDEGSFSYMSISCQGCARRWALYMVMAHPFRFFLTSAVGYSVHPLFYDLHSPLDPRSDISPAHVPPISPNVSFSYLCEQMPWMYGKLKRREELLNNLEGVLETVSLRTMAGRNRLVFAREHHPLCSTTAQCRFFPWTNTFPRRCGVQLWCSLTPSSPTSFLDLLFSNWNSQLK